MKAPSTIRDAYEYFETCHGSEHPERSLDELRDKIHEWGLKYGQDDDGWRDFWDEIFESGWVLDEPKPCPRSRQGEGGEMFDKIMEIKRRSPEQELESWMPILGIPTEEEAEKEERERISRHFKLLNWKWLEEEKGK